jgi:hypothetical protein
MMPIPHSNHLASQYRRSMIKQRDVTAPIMSVSRDFRRRIAVNTLLTCSKVTARIKISHVHKFHMWQRFNKVTCSRGVPNQ